MLMKQACRGNIPIAHNLIKNSARQTQAIQTITRKMSSHTATVKMITPVDFQKLMGSSDRSNYQMIDVREENELQIAKFPGADILNLPLSQMEHIGEQIKQGKLLDRMKPTICICRRGARAGRFATFLG